MKTTLRQKFGAAVLVHAVALMPYLLSANQAWAQPADSAIGTWELNLAKSRFEPGPAPKSQIRTYDVPVAEGTLRVKGTDSQGRPTVVDYPVPRASGVVKMSAKGVDAGGKPTLMEYTAAYDGKDYVFSGNPNADTISLKRVDDTTVEATTRKAGKIATTGKRVVSKDGKVMTITSKGTDAAGHPVSNTLVFDRRATGP
jgi:hypothetical protein